VPLAHQRCTGGFRLAISGKIENVPNFGTAQG